MIKNNVFSILTYALCFVIFFIGAVLVRNFTIGGGIVGILVWLIYFFAGTKFQIQGTSIKNLISVSSLGIIGLLFFIFSIGNTSFSVIAKGLFGGFLVPSLGIIFIVPKLVTKYFPLNQYILLIFAWIPSILMWVGLQWKTTNKKQTPSNMNLE